jgi:hypothetical protein
MNRAGELNTLHKNPKMPSVQKISLRIFMFEAMKSVFGFKYDELCYGSIWLKVGTARQPLLKVSEIEFYKRNLTNGAGAQTRLQIGGQS